MSNLNHWKVEYSSFPPKRCVHKLCRSATNRELKLMMALHSTLPTNHVIALPPNPTLPTNILQCYICTGAYFASMYHWKVLHLSVVVLGCQSLLSIDSYSLFQIRDPMTGFLFIVLGASRIFKTLWFKSALYIFWQVCGILGNVLSCYQYFN